MSYDEINEKLKQFCEVDERIENATGFNKEEFDIILKDGEKYHPEFFKEDGFLKLFYVCLWNKYYIAYEIIDKILRIDSKTAQEWNLISSDIKNIVWDKLKRPFSRSNKRVKTLNQLYFLCPSLETFYPLKRQYKMEYVPDILSSKSYIKIDTNIDFIEKLINLSPHERVTIIGKINTLTLSRLFMVCLIHKYNITLDLASTLLKINRDKLRRYNLMYLDAIGDIIKEHFPDKVNEFYNKPLSKISTIEGFNKLFNADDDFLKKLEITLKDEVKSVKGSHLHSKEWEEDIESLKKLYPNRFKDCEFCKGVLNPTKWYKHPIIFVTKDRVLKEIYVKMHDNYWVLFNDFFKENLSKLDKKQQLKEEILRLRKELVNLGK